MADSSENAGSWLLLRVRGRACALPLAHVVEVCRPLPFARIGEGPAFILGAAVLRGAPVPVVDLDRLLGGPGGAIGRFVTLNVGDRRAVLAVEEVVGIGPLPAKVGVLPPLLDNDCVQALGRLDGELLLVLRSARVVESAQGAA